MPIKHSCGIGAVYNSTSLLRDLYTLGIWNQHRGDESAGIALFMDGQVGLFKHYGTVNDLFSKKMSGVDVKSDRGLIHGRYSTTGDSTETNSQPVRMKNVAIGHQGNILNSDELREIWGREYDLKTTLDSEIIACICHKHENPFEAFEVCEEQCIGAYNVVGVNGRGQIFAHRDSRAFHPLFFGIRGDSLYVNSEDIGLSALGMYGENDIREFKPGETIVFSDNGPESRIFQPKGRLERCYFEPLYFMLHASTHKGKVVSDIRKDIGRLLARKYPVDADIVIPVMDSGYDYARGYSIESGMPFSQGIAKNRNVGRTYTTPENKGEKVPDVLRMSRMEKSKLKNVPITSRVKNKKVIVGEDSIVRLNVAKGIAGSLFQAGAYEVYFMIGSPPIRYPCFFGMDHSTRRELAAAPYKTIEEANEMVAKEIADEVGIDRKRIHVHYNSIEDIKGPLNDEGDHCFSCLNGDYYCGIPETERFREAFRL